MVVRADAGDEIFFIVSKSHLEQPVPYLNPHGVTVEGFGLVGDVNTQAAKRPVEGAGEGVVGMVELVIAADKNTLGDIKVDACRKTACKIPCAAYIFHFGEFEGIPAGKDFEVFSKRVIKARRR